MRIKKINPKFLGVKSTEARLRMMSAALQDAGYDRACYVRQHHNRQWHVHPLAGVGKPTDIQAAVALLSASAEPAMSGSPA